MPEFDIVFQKLAELTSDAPDQFTIDSTVVTMSELDEIEELRRFAAEIRDPEPSSFTTT